MTRAAVEQVESEAQVVLLLRAKAMLFAGFSRATCV